MCSAPWLQQVVDGSARGRTLSKHDLGRDPVRFDADAASALLAERTRHTGSTPNADRGRTPAGFAGVVLTGIASIGLALGMPDVAFANEPVGDSGDSPRVISVSSGRMLCGPDAADMANLADLADSVELAAASCGAVADEDARETPRAEGLGDRTGQANAHAPLFVEGESRLRPVALIDDRVARVAKAMEGSLVSLRVQRAGRTAGARGSVLNGTGIVLDAAGLILTNEHVIHDAATITVTNSAGVTRPGRVLATDLRGDLALVEVVIDGLRTAPLAPPDAVRVGQTVVALGNPFGLASDGKMSVSTGVISNMQRSLPGLSATEDRDYSNMIQTTAVVHPGHSGGALVNLRGEIVGLITAVYMRTPDSAGIGFALPLDEITMGRVAALRSGHEPQRGFAGLVVGGSAPTAAGARSKGVKILQVEGPAREAGLRRGDEIRAIDARSVRTPQQVLRHTATAAPGTSLSLLVARGTRVFTVEVPIVPREDIALAQRD